MTAIGPGDWVECIRVSEPSPDYPDPGFSLGSIYVVSESGMFCNCPWILCDRMPRPPAPYVGWNALAFRPIYRPKSSLIEGLETPISELVE